MSENKKIQTINLRQSNTKEETFLADSQIELFSDTLDNTWITDKLKYSELNIKLAKLLIEAGCNMNYQDFNFQESPVFKAILNNNYDLVKLLVIEGSDMSLKNNFGNDMLSRSIQLGRFKIARLLVVADSPIRVYSCFYKIPHHIENLSNRNREINLIYGDQYEYGDGIGDEELSNNDNFLQYSILKYEEFLYFLKKYTQEPRSLLDIARLKVRNLMKKPISKSLPLLGYLPEQVKSLIMLEDIEKKL